MPFRQLENYLRTYRKHAGLTQGEMAFLLGCLNSTEISRYEKRHRLPPLERTLAYEAVLGVPIAKLFAGMQQRIRQDVEKRRLKLRPKLGIRKLADKIPATDDLAEPLGENRVLALDVHPRHFGFVVLEGPKRLLDWGVRNFRAGVNTVKVPAGKKLLALLNEFDPSIVVMREYGTSTLRNAAMVTTLQNQIKTRKIPIKFISHRTAKITLVGSHSNKHAVAVVLTKQLPILASKLPPKRKPWESEDYRMSIFDAAALGVAYFSQASEQMRLAQD